MSLIQTVAALVEEAGTAHADQLLPDCPGYTRQQVISALQNAAQLGLIHCVARRCAGRPLGALPGIYAPGRSGETPKLRRAPVASVWDYAQRMGQ